jgi:hypothetical protein
MTTFANRLAIVAAVCAAGACTHSVSTTSTITPSSITMVSTDEVRRVLSALAADSMEGRGTGTVGGARAARFIADEFRKAGLEPGGDSGYFQRVPLRVRRMRDSVTGRAWQTAAAVPSFAARDTFPADQRGIAVNVIGILRGSDPVLKDSIVLVDAHYDHLGLSRFGPIDVDSAAAAMQARMRLPRDQQRNATIRVNMDSIRRVHPTPRRDSVYNGADDDAAGTTAVIEIARQLAREPRPKRTIVFAATTGEEVGLIGTRWYIAHPAFPIATMQANLEIEMIGRPDSLSGGVGGAWLTGFERSTMGEMFAAAGLRVYPDKRPDQQFFQRSDNIAFARAGIPAHTLSSFNLHTDYHQLTDDISSVDFVHMAGVINTGVAAVRILGNGTAPRWNPGGKP